MIRDLTPLRALCRAAAIFAAAAAPPAVRAETPAEPARPFYLPFGLDLTAQDGGTRPQDDFFRYVNGAWLDRTPIPPDQDRVTTGKDASNRVEAALHSLLEAAAAAAPERPATTEQKAGAMYAAFMDEARIEKLGASPIRGLLDQARRAGGRAAIARLMGRSFQDFGGSLFAINFDIDLKDVDHYAVYLAQSGLGMPDRDYYLKADFASEKKAYQAYIERLLALAGSKHPAADAAGIVDLETKLAAVSWTKAEQRDLTKIYNPMSPAELAQRAPGFPWADFFAGAGLASRKRFVVQEASAFPKIAGVFAAAPLDLLRAWVVFRIADSSAGYLSTPFQRARFEFWNRTLSGEPDRRRSPGREGGLGLLRGSPG